MYCQKPNGIQTVLAAEVQLLEMISAGAPLPQILDKVCTLLDVQMGNVVSLVLLPDDEEHTHHKIAQSAAKFGLTAFSCVSIVSPSEEFLGTLETYSCFLRKPNLSENQLIEQAAHLAALAIQQYNHEVEAEDWHMDWTGATGTSPHERPPSTN